VPTVSRTPIAKSAFANADGRVRCPTPDCWGDLLLFPTGARDEEGMPEFQPYTACPLCGGVVDIEQDMTDRDWFLRVAWLRANPWDDDGIGPDSSLS
jgi:hypothetical protein